MLGLVGESGSGKSLTALAIMGLLQKPLLQTSGEIVFEDARIDNLGSSARRALRGREMSMIFQEPMTALNPVSPVGRQIAEMFVLHDGLSWREAHERAVDALAAVKVPAPARRAEDYPHQLSGGMRQRAMIAMALACRPKLLIADEPTTALDVTVQAQIMDLVLELCSDLDTAVLLISHDLGLIGQTCDEIVVMYGGQTMEQGTAKNVLNGPRNPYTKALLSSLPRLGMRKRGIERRLTEISDTVPTLGNFPPGCPFAPRCPRAEAICTDVPASLQLLPTDDPTGLSTSERQIRCHFND